MRNGTESRYFDYSLQPKSLGHSKRRLQPILAPDEPLGISGIPVHVHRVTWLCSFPCACLNLIRHRATPHANACALVMQKTLMMDAPGSPVFEDPGDLKPGERWASSPVLGEGYHATAQLQLAFLRLQWMFDIGQLILRPADKQSVPKGNAVQSEGYPCYPRHWALD